MTARQRDRDSVKKSASESDFVPSQPTDLSLRTPKPDVSARPKQGSRSSAPKEVGFIAMLFQVIIISSKGIESLPQIKTFFLYIFATWWCKQPLIFQT